MKFLRNRRRLALLGALAVFVALTLWVVLPAFAATSTGFAGNITKVSPTYLASGGQNDCSLFMAQPTGTAVGTDQYFASNPKAINGKQQILTALNGATVKLTVTVDKSYTYLSFSVSGAVVTDVGIKGGNGTDWYNYEGQPGGGVTTDTRLTAPAQSADYTAPFYGISQTVFCYTPKITCVPNVALSDPQHPGETIELPSCAGKDNVFFDFNSGTLDDGSHRNFVSVYSHGGTGTANTPMVEHVVLTLPGSTQPTLQYSDLDPSDTAFALHDMRFCQRDPRAGGSDPLALADAYKSISTAGDVLQSPTTEDPESTSCLITDRTWVDTSGVVNFEAYVYTDIDGLRTSG